MTEDLFKVVGTGCGCTIIRTKGVCRGCREDTLGTPWSTRGIDLEHPYLHETRRSKLGLVIPLEALCVGF